MNLNRLSGIKVVSRFNEAQSVDLQEIQQFLSRFFRILLCLPISSSNTLLDTKNLQLKIELNKILDTGFQVSTPNNFGPNNYNALFSYAVLFILFAIVNSTSILFLLLMRRRRIGLFEKKNFDLIVTFQ